jgi:hypothetical protein
MGGGGILVAKRNASTTVNTTHARHHLLKTTTTTTTNHRPTQQTNNDTTNQTNLVEVLERLLARRELRRLWRVGLADRAVGKELGEVLALLLGDLRRRRQRAQAAVDLAQHVLELLLGQLFGLGFFFRVLLLCVRFFSEGDGKVGGANAMTVQRLRGARKKNTPKQQCTRNTHTLKAATTTPYAPRRRR